MSNPSSESSTSIECINLQNINNLQRREPSATGESNSQLNGNVDIAASNSYTGSSRLVSLTIESESQFTTGTTMKSVWVVISLVLFGSFLFLAVTSDLQEVKHETVRFLYEQSLETYLDFGYVSMNATEALFFIYFLTHSAPYNAFLDALRKRQRQRQRVRLVLSRMVNLTTYALLISSLFGTILATIDGGGGWAGVQNWSINSVVVKYPSLILALGIFCWTPTSFGNDELLRKLYGTNTTAITLTFGTMHMVKEAARICAEVVQTLIGAEAQYREIISIRDLDRKYNEALENNIRVMIIQNIFLLTFLAEEFLENETFVLINIALLINAIKDLIFYWLCSRIHKHGKKITLCAKRLQRTFGELVIDGERVILKILVDELKDDPISVGTDGFLINETFIIGIISAVITFFALLAAARHKGS